MDPVRFLKKLLGDRCGCLYHMLAVVEDDEKSSRANELDELQARFVRFQRKSEGCADCTNDKSRIINASKIDEIDRSAEFCGKGVPGSHGNGGLPDAARTKEGHEPLFAQALLNVAQDQVAANHSTRARGQDAHVAIIWIIDLPVDKSSHRTDKRIASALHVCDVSVSEFAVPKRFSDRGDMDAETALLDHNVRPDGIDEFSFCEDFAETLGEIDQDIQRPATERKRGTIVLKDSLATRKFKRAELQFSVNVIVRHGFQRGFVMSRKYPHNRDATEVRADWSILACGCSRVQLHHQGSAAGDGCPTSLSPARPTLPSRQL